MGPEIVLGRCPNIGKLRAGSLIPIKTIGTQTTRFVRDDGQSLSKTEGPEFVFEFRALKIPVILVEVALTLRG